MDRIFELIFGLLIVAVTWLGVSSMVEFSKVDLYRIIYEQHSGSDRFIASVKR